MEVGPKLEFNNKTVECSWTRALKISLKLNYIFWKNYNYGHILNSENCSAKFEKNLFTDPP